MKNIIISIFSLLLFAISGCGINNGVIEGIKNETGIEISKNSKIKEHSINAVGLNGDGCEIYVIKLSDEDAKKALNTIKSSKEWHSGSFSSKDADTSVIEKTGSKTMFIEGHLNDKGGIGTSYEGIMFKDRTPRADGNVKKEDVLNYTFSVFDSETKLLHIYRFDS